MNSNARLEQRHNSNSTPNSTSRIHRPSSSSSPNRHVNHSSSQSPPDPNSLALPHHLRPQPQPFRSSYNPTPKPAPGLTTFVADSENLALCKPVPPLYAVSPLRVGPLDTPSVHENEEAYARHHFFKEMNDAARSRRRPFYDNGRYGWLPIYFNVEWAKFLRCLDDKRLADETSRLSLRVGGEEELAAIERQTKRDAEALIPGTSLEGLMQERLKELYHDEICGEEVRRRVRSRRELRERLRRTAPAARPSGSEHASGCASRAAPSRQSDEKPEKKESRASTIQWIAEKLGPVPVNMTNVPDTPEVGMQFVEEKLRGFRLQQAGQQQQQSRQSPSRSQAQGQSQSQSERGEKWNKIPESREGFTRWVAEKLGPVPVKMANVPDTKEGRTQFVIEKLGAYEGVRQQAVSQSLARAEERRSHDVRPASRSEDGEGYEMSPRHERERRRRHGRYRDGSERESRARRDRDGSEHHKSSRQRGAGKQRESEKRR